MVFGAVAAVLHYNVFSRTLAELVTRYRGILLLRFFDDFGSLTPSCLTPLDLQTFTSFCALLGVKLKETRSAYGPRLVFLGMGRFPPSAPRTKCSCMFPFQMGKKERSGQTLSNPPYRRGG